MMKLDAQEKELFGEGFDIEEMFEGQKIAAQTLLMDYYRCSHFIELLSIFYEVDKFP